MTDLTDEALRGARRTASTAVTGAILRMARDAGRQTHQHPAFPGSQSMLTYTAPADGILFALMLRSAASGEVRTYIRRAREEGITWRQVGEILKPALWDEELDPYDLGVKAYDYAVGAEHADRFTRLSFAWNCPVCSQRIRDLGPFEANPRNCEEGHAVSCERMAAQVAAYEAEWGDE